MRMKQQIRSFEKTDINWDASTVFAVNTVMMASGVKKTVHARGR